jgi:tetratricopeptide (TPR) repeat protein
MTFLGPAAGSRIPKSLFRLLAAAVFLLASAVFVYGGGSRDEALSRADTLIENRQYDEAIRVLSSYMKTKPEKFKEAQERLQQIIRIREQYNAIADELLDVLRDNPGDNERILELTEALNAIEPSSNPSAEKFLEQVQALAVFNRNRARLEEIFAAGRALLEAGDYSGAMAAYAGGLDIYQEEFFAAGYGEETERLAREGLESISRDTSDFSAFVSSFSRTADNIKGSGGETDLDDFLEFYDAFSSGMGELIRRRDDLREVVVSFDTRQAELQREYESLGDRSFLSFAPRLIHGPAGQNEGMLGALDRLWEDKVSLAEAAVSARADALYEEAYAAADNREYSHAVSLLESAAEYIAISLDFINRRYVYEEADNPPVTTLFDEMVLSEKKNEYLKYRAMAMAIPVIRDAGLLGEKAEDLLEGGFPALAAWQEGRMDAAEAGAAEQEVRGFFAALRGDLALMRAALDDGSSSIGNYRRAYEDSEEGFNSALRVISGAGAIVDGLDAFIGEQILASAARRYTIANGDFQKEVRAREEEFREANSLMQGIPQTLEGGGEYTARYPSEGLAILTELSRSASVNLTMGRQLLATYSAESREVLDSSGVAPLYTGAREMVDRITGLQSRAGPLMATARTQVSQASALRSDGDRLFREAQAAMIREDFDLARERLDQAATRYHDSLAIQESVALRATWDTQLVNLGAEIAARLNEIVVRDVRVLVSNAKNAYYSGDFEQADTLLVRAQNRWRTTNSTENSEVNYWTNLVRGAMSLQAGKTIPVTAPLYAEMSQLLSDARRYFEEGSRMLNSGRRQAGLARFTEALQKTREVRIMFPMNQEARILELRMEQVTDPAAFERTFRDRVNEAVAGTKPGVRSQESFATLQELAIINPRYPNIAGIIQQAKVDMGMIPPAPDPRAIARANELVREARRIIDAQNSIQYQVALAQLDRAILLNPDNNDAVIAKDILLTRMTGTGVIVIDSNSRDLYGQAVQQLQQGNIITAMAIVQQLLQNPKNRNSTQILDLQRKIESLL